MLSGAIISNFGDGTLVARLRQPGLVRVGEPDTDSRRIKAESQWVGEERPAGRVGVVHGEVLAGHRDPVAYGRAKLRPRCDLALHLATARSRSGADGFGAERQHPAPPQSPRGLAMGHLLLSGEAVG